MTSPRFVHVTLTCPSPQEQPLLTRQLDAVLASQSLDWLRYAWNCYILWTSSDLQTIVRKLRGIPGTQHHSVFASEMHIDTMPNQAAAFFPPWIWDWLTKDRGRGPIKFTPFS